MTYNSTLGGCCGYVYVINLVLTSGFDCNLKVSYDYFECSADMNGDGPFDITDFDITESDITNLI